MTRIAMPLALTLSAASAAHADSLACDHAALARAEATVLDAQARYATATGWRAPSRRPWWLSPPKATW